MLKSEIGRARRRWGKSIHKRVKRVGTKLAGRKWFAEIIADVAQPNVPLAAPQEHSPAARQAEASPWQRSPSRLNDGLCVVGYVTSEIGLGQAARNLMYAGDAGRIPISAYGLPLAGRENEPEFNTKKVPVPDRRASVLVTGLPSIVHLEHEMRGGRFNILYPFWELSGVPEDWRAVARRFDEIWAPSSFVAGAMRQIGGNPVHLVRQPVRLPKVLPPPRATVSGAFRFLTYFDYDSYGARKNPLGAIEAFRRAFEGQQCDVELVVKTRGGADNGLRQTLALAADKDRRIRVIDRTLTRGEVDELVRECDVFVSLHRSEGFGFGAAEALAAGRGVIATDYGGTTDFINADTAYPVSYDLVEVKADEYLAHEGQKWADPHVDAAADAMRAVFGDPEECRRRVERGFAHLHEHHSMPAVGARVAQLLRDRGLA